MKWGGCCPPHREGKAPGGFSSIPTSGPVFTVEEKGRRSIEPHRNGITLLMTRTSPRLLCKGLNEGDQMGVRSAVTMSVTEAELGAQ